MRPDHEPFDFEYDGLRLILAVICAAFLLCVAVGMWHAAQPIGTA